MAEKIIKYYEEIVEEHKWNKINWIILLSIIGVSFISVIYQRTIAVGTIIFDVIFVIIITLISFLVSLRVFKEIIDKYKLNINNRKTIIFLGDKNFKEVFREKKKQLIKRKLLMGRNWRIVEKNGEKWKVFSLIVQNLQKIHLQYGMKMIK